MSLEQDFAKNIRLILIHPNYYQQHLLLTHFVISKAAVYVRLEGGRLEAGDALEQIEVVLKAAIQADFEYIVVDECDRATPSALDAIIIDLLQRLLSVRIVLLSRYLPHIILDNPTIRTITRIIPVDSGIGLSDYTIVGNIPNLEVRAFGQGRVWVDGREVTNWNGQLSRNLFFYLIDNPIITRDVVFQTFWPDMSVSAATNVFHVTKGNIHDALGFELIEFSGTYYHLTDNAHLIYDVNVFHEMSQSGMQSPDETLLLTAYQLFKHSFLQDTEMPWVVTRREELELEYSETMSILSNLKMAAGEADSALGLNIRLLSKNRAREDLAERIMTLYLQRNKPCDALKIYNQTAQFLQETLRTVPDKPLQEAGEQARKLCVDNS
jgi:DNA-binding SARP family transcriptional activator